MYGCVRCRGKREREPGQTSFILLIYSFLLRTPPAAEAHPGVASFLDIANKYTNKSRISELRSEQGLIIQSCMFVCGMHIKMSVSAVLAMWWRWE